jgi:hypothetical protein
MPDAPQILASLTSIAGDGIVLAIAWHVVVLGLIVAVLAGWRPARRTVGLAIAAPLVTASVLAFSYGNPFNGAVLAALALIVAYGALQRPERAELTPVCPMGYAMIAFALVYPHFLGDRAWFAYLWGAPVGLIPCPTLALAVGATLLTGAPAGRRAAYALAAAALFYGLFGAIRLGVWIDVALVLGGAALIARTAQRTRRHATDAHRLRPAHAH